MEITHILSVAGIIFLLAFLVESFVEYFFGILTQKIAKLAPFSWLLIYLSAGVGVGLAFWYQFDFISLSGDFLGETIAVSPVGMILTGLMIGRGSNYVHDIFKMVLGLTEKLKA